jgi:hypothetical protein
MTTKEDPTVTTKTSVATTVDTRTVAELEAAVIAGDASITAEQLATARARQDHTPLPASTSERRAQLTAEAARQGQIGKLRDDIESLADDRERLLTLAQQASDALRALFTAARAREDQLDALAGRAKALGINAMSHDDQVRDPSGIGWRREHAMAGPARIRLGDTALSAADPRRLVAWIVKDTRPDRSTNRRVQLLRGSVTVLIRGSVTVLGAHTVGCGAMTAGGSSGRSRVPVSGGGPGRVKSGRGSRRL